MSKDNKSLLESMSHSLNSIVAFNNNNHNEYAEKIERSYIDAIRLRNHGIAKLMRFYIWKSGNKKLW